MRVLIVEDEANLREALCEILQSRGFEVDGVSDGKKGLHAAMSGLFDVVLLDVMLPKLNGFEILKKMRKNEIMTPVIITTALGANENVKKGIESGADSYVTKPFNVDNLIRTIRSVTGSAQDKVLQLGDVSLDSATNTVSINGKSAELSEIESALLSCFIKNESIVVPYQTLSESAATEKPDEYIGMLKRKLNYLKSDIDILHIKGLGYKLMMSDAPNIDWDKGF